ncbi:hypothetical protein [Aurantiacibacter spongiae]|uniref:Uncharacterized protein n=1 Tax=Aurantiacibacter spongiae TaxID=2488860 RepID=A0A3N5D736_9SPHN|nr:hypothetical protein [Aurantiacibacter spongiae]RPF70318.1 hypothetical protein EG799_00745 [Aurantiacibacter spongiae]
MTKPNEPALSGEERFRRKRRRFWGFYVASVLASMAVAGGLGLAAGLFENGDLPGGAVIAIWIAAVLGFAWFSWWWFRRIDEVDLLDNLWASTIAFYAYVIAFGSWTILGDTQLVPPVDHGLIALFSVGVLVLAYLARKLGLR